MPRRKPITTEPPPDPGPGALPDLFDGDPVRWADIDATVLRACLDALTGQGHAVLLGRTTSGDGLTACFFVGSNKAKKFWNTPDACMTFMRGYTEWLLANQG